MSELVFISKQNFLIFTAVADSFKDKNAQNLITLRSKYAFRGFSLEDVAVRSGFEPEIRYSRIHAFQACAFSHSAISPFIRERALFYG